MTSYGDILYAKQLFVDGKEVKGDSSTGLPEVLAVENEAPGQTMSVGRLNAGDDPGTASLNGDINADTMECNTMNAFTAVVTPQCSATQVNTTNGFITNVFAGDITSTGTITYSSFNPPLSSVGTPSLAAAMTVGNSVGLNALDMNNQDIQNANSIGANGTVSCTTIQCNEGQVIAGPLVGGDGELQVNNTDASTTAKINFTGVAGSAQDTFLEGDSSVTGGEPKLTRCTYLDLTDSTNSFPSVVAGDLAATLALGNNAGSTGIDMNNQAISNALSVGATAVQALQASFTSLGASAATVNGTTAPYSGLLNMNASTGGTSKIDFTGVSGTATQDTEIEGDDTLNASGQVKRTKCTYLDLTDSTNLFTPNDNEIYEWGAHWVTPQTTRIGGTTLNYVFFGSQTDLPPQGWRFVQAMSNGSSDFSENKYAYIPGNKPFYAKTASTTIPAHASQIIEFTYPVTEYGDGRIFWGLYYSLDNDEATKTFMPFSGRMFLNNITGGGVQAADIRMGGYLTMKWVMKNAFPTDGTVWRIYPVFRTDTNQTGTRGHFDCYIGDGVPTDPLLTWATGESLANGNGMRQQVFMRGYPFPANWTEFQGF